MKGIYVEGEDPAVSVGVHYGLLGLRLPRAVVLGGTGHQAENKPVISNQGLSLARLLTWGPSLFRARPSIHHPALISHLLPLPHGPGWSHRILHGCCVYSEQVVLVPAGIMPLQVTWC